jgi:hypothetical protein
MSNSSMSRPANDGHYAVYWPRTPRQAKVQKLANRLPSLEGRTIAQLWDYLFRGDRVFEYVEEALKARFPGVKFVSWKEFGNTHGSDEHAVLASLPEKLRTLKVDAVISAMGC